MPSCLSTAAGLPTEPPAARPQPRQGHPVCTPRRQRLQAPAPQPCAQCPTRSAHAEQPALRRHGRCCQAQPAVQNGGRPCRPARQPGALERLHPRSGAGRRPGLRDSAPGLAPALASDPIEIAVRIGLLNNTTMEFVARVPTVEMAVVIKAFAYASRRVDRDIEDIYRLFEVVDAYPAEVIGGWRLDEPDLRGSRRDASVHLRELGRRPRQLRTADVPSARLAALIAGHLHSPDSQGSDDERCWSERGDAAHASKECPVTGARAS